MSRDLKTIQTEFAALCQRAGHCQYEIHARQKDLEVINNQLRDLNFEAAKVKEAEAKAAEAAKENK